MIHSARYKTHEALKEQCSAGRSQTYEAQGPTPVSVQEFSMLGHLWHTCLLLHILITERLLCIQNSYCEDNLSRVGLWELERS